MMFIILDVDNIYGGLFFIDIMEVFIYMYIYCIKFYCVQ